jgi:hypothetical protein
VTGRTGSRTAHVVGLLLATAALAGSFLVLARGSESASPPSLKTVPARFLEGIELRVGLPSLDRPVVSRAQAEGAAVEGYPGRAIRESVLATCIAPQLNETCWLVSLSAEGLHSSAGTPSHPAPPQSFNYLLVVIDAYTGQFVTAFSGT